MIRGRHYKVGSGLAVAVIMAVFFAGVLMNTWNHDAEAAGNLATEPKNKHNLSTSGPGPLKATIETRICVFCHTPHHAITSEPLLTPLWNHKLSSASYDFSGLPSTLINTTSMPSRDIDGGSKTCMSCHDGTVGVGELAGGTTISMTGSMDPGAILGTTPSHHEFSVPINQNLIDDSITLCQSGVSSMRIKFPWQATFDAPANSGVKLKPTAQTYEGTAGVSTPTAPSPPYKAGFNYGIQCGTCHDPHYYHENAFSISCEFLTGGACVDYYDPQCLACHTQDSCF